MTNINLQNELQLLENNIGQFNSKMQNFITSLILQHKRKQHLSPKQVHWVDKLSKQVTGEVKDIIEPIGDTAKLFDMFRLSGSKIKRPKITMRFTNAVGAEHVVQLQYKKKHSDYIAVVGLHDSGYRKVYYGFIAGDKFKQSSKFEEEMKSLFIFLKAIVKDPAKAVADYGILTGHCCFCNKHLTDDRSKDVGYGKTCAGNYGLPWGGNHV